jgi:hypothetical protein
MVTRKVISGVVLDLPASDQRDPQQSTFKIQVIPDLSVFTRLLGHYRGFTRP